ncbi:MAG: glycosyltransferase family 2 protein [Bryobacteraceae bacterium]
MITPIQQGTFARGVSGSFQFSGSLTVFFPAYNDAPSLPSLLERTFDTVRRFVADFEVIVVNDGSYDDTARVLEDLAVQYAPHLRVITHPRNLGYGAALRTGFHAATKDYVFYTDGDGQYDPADLEHFLRVAGPDTGLVNGYKLTRNDPWHRIAIGWLYNQFARWLFGIHLRDIDCDFRLIRRSVFDPAALRSTGGTICVELVRNLELSGAPVIELPVRHYAREHGRSQFFRVRSLAITFFQLLQVFYRLVVLPAFSPELPQPRPARSHLVWVGILIAILSTFAYARALSLPFIADDYVQIQLARDYGPVSKWSALAQDALYRCRATSLVMTYWIEQVFGLKPIYFNLASLLLHIVNALLVFALGYWRSVGWKLSAIAAAYFAISQRHSEAVIWFAAVPELLVFCFVLTSFLCWIAWLQAQKPALLWYLAAFASYMAALLSKESAVALVPLLALALLVSREVSWKRIGAMLPFAAAAGGYFALIYAARNNHLHFNDGTFSLSAPVFEVILRSSWGLLWVWGAVGLLLAALRFLSLSPRIFVSGLGWMIISLVPYSFLTYMPRVPSRHTYLASVGLSLIVAASLVALRQRVAFRKPWLVPAVVAVIFLHETGYIWTVLHRRYELRAQPTELLLNTARTAGPSIFANCFPYSHYVADYALMIEFPENAALHFENSPEAAKQPASQNFCNDLAQGTRY